MSFVIITVVEIGPSWCLSQDKENALLFEILRKGLI